MPFITLFVVFVVAMVVVAVFATGLSSKCSACGKWWATREIERRETGRENGLKTVKRTDVRKDATGKVVESVERDETIGVLRITFDTLVRCKHCGHEAHKTVVEEKEVAPPEGIRADHRRLMPKTGRQLASCALCGGDGRRFAEPCPACSGRGTVLVAAPPTRCDDCLGRGTKFAQTCPICGGSGWRDAIAE